MSLPEMQACLARLYVDRTARRLFALEPETVLAEYGLAADEAQALRALDLAALERFARSLRGKRRRRFAATYPLLFGLESPVVERYYNRYYQLYPARPGGAYASELLEFGRFVEECLAAEDEAPPFASDLAQYERLCFLTRQAASPPTPPLSHSPLLPTDRPRLADGVAVGTFRTGILAIVEALKAGLPPPETGKGPYTFVFRPEPGATSPAAFYVTEATARLLDRCDGERTVAELAAVENEDPGDGTASAVAGAIWTLLEQGILTTVPAGPSTSPAPVPDLEPWLPDGH